MSKTIEVVVKLELRDDADISEVISEMDYDFRHLSIEDTDVVDVITEL